MLQSPATLFNKQTSIAPISGLSNEILCILVAQRTSKLWEVKVAGLKSNSDILGRFGAAS